MPKIQPVRFQINSLISDLPSSSNFAEVSNEYADVISKDPNIQFSEDSQLKHSDSPVEQRLAFIGFYTGIWKNWFQSAQVVEQLDTIVGSIEAKKRGYAPIHRDLFKVYYKIYHPQNNEYVANQFSTILNTTQKMLEVGIPEYIDSEYYTRGYGFFQKREAFAQKLREENLKVYSHLLSQEHAPLRLPLCFGMNFIDRTITVLGYNKFLGAGASLVGQVFRDYLSNTINILRTGAIIEYPEKLVQYLKEHPEE